MYSHRYPITPVVIMEYFLSHFSYISLDMSENELQKWLDNRPELKKESIIQVAEQLSDYLLCIGSTVQE